MKQLKVVMPHDNFVIYDMSDLHVGSPNCSEETLEELIEEIRVDDKAYIIFKGDAMESITPKDKRYRHSCVRDQLKSPQEQADRVIELFSPVANKILAWGIGNHEEKLLDVCNFGKYICGGLGIPDKYSSYVFVLHYYTPEDYFMFKTFHTHGMGSFTSNAKDEIQYEANRKAALKHRLAKSAISDCIYMSRGHDHQLIVVEPTVSNKLYLSTTLGGVKQHYHQSVAQNSPYIPPDNRWYATTGSFRKIYSNPNLDIVDYAEIAGYAPSEIGCVKVHVVEREIYLVEKYVCK